MPIQCTCSQCGKRLRPRKPSDIPTSGRTYCYPCKGAALTRPLADRLWDRTDRHGACWLSAFKHLGRGYAQIRIAELRANKGVTHVAWYLATGTWPPPRAVILHTCDTPLCVRNDDAGTYQVGERLLLRRGHLALGTQADNLTDMAIKRRSTHGERNARSKLAAADVLLIRQLADLGIPHVQIASTVGISQMTVSLIVRRKQWRHLSDSPA